MKNGSKKVPQKRSRTEQIKLWVSAEEKDELTRAAEEAGSNVSNFIRMVALREARRPSDPPRQSGR